jgi:hypothetical protein
MANFGGIDYAPELFTLQDQVERLDAAAESIKTSLIDIQANTAIIEERVTLIADSINVFKTLGSDCNEGIRVYSTENKLTRALTMVSLKDSNELEDYTGKLNSESYTDYGDLISLVYGS